MTASSTSYTLLHNLSSRRKDQHSYIDLLLSGFESTENDALLSLIRTSGLSPRGRKIDSEIALIKALSERSWDLVLCTSGPLSQISPEAIVNLIRNQGRELPVIQLSQNTGLDAQIAATRAGVTHLVDNSAEQLLVSKVLQEYQIVSERRRLHKAEIALEQSLHLIAQLTSHSDLAIAKFSGSQIVQINPAFHTLFNLKDTHHLPSVEDIAIGADLEQLKEALNQPISKTLENIEFFSGEGHSFEATVELIDVRLPNERYKRMHIDPLGTFLGNKRNRDIPLTAQEIFIQTLETTTQAALSGGHDALLMHLHLSSLDTSDPVQSANEDIDKLMRLIRRETNAQLVHHLENGDVAVLYSYTNQKPSQFLASNLLKIADRIHFESLPRKRATIGIININDNAPQVTALIEGAQAAALEALDSDDRIHTYLDEETRQIEIESASHQLEDAIRNRHLKLMYQPLVPLDPNPEDQHFETLVRMVDSQNREIFPAQFMQSLEHANVMVKMDRWVVETALLSIKSEMKRFENCRLFINISRRTLRSRPFAPWIATQLNELEIPGNLLIFQLSETDVAADIEFAKVFSKAIHRIGAKICIKHFGCSTNSQLVFNSIRPEYIKLDGSFIQELNSGQVGQTAIKKLLEPTRDKNVQVIAPLIEEVRQLGELYRIGIDIVQGYYLQPPQESMEYEYFNSD